jgi:hypothetical protein
MCVRERETHRKTQGDTCMCAHAHTHRERERTVDRERAREGERGVCTRDRVHPGKKKGEV